MKTKRKTVAVGKRLADGWWRVRLATRTLLIPPHEAWPKERPQ